METKTVQAKEPGYYNIMTEIFGDSQHLRVLGFFLEHPLHKYTIVYLHERLDISRDNVTEILRFYETKGYLTREEVRGPYKLNNKDPMIRAIGKSVMETLGDVIYYEWNHMPRPDTQGMISEEGDISQLGMKHLFSNVFNKAKTAVSAA